MPLFGTSQSINFQNTSLVGGSDSAFVSTAAAELKFNRNPAIHPPYDIVKQCPSESPWTAVVDMHAVVLWCILQIGTTVYSEKFYSLLLFWSRLVHADLAMHATLAALGTLTLGRRRRRVGDRGDAVIGARVGDRRDEKQGDLVGDRGDAPR